MCLLHKGGDLLYRSTRGKLFRILFRSKNLLDNRSEGRLCRCIKEDILTQNLDRMIELRW
jgi:hypothetical protein